MTRAPRPLLVIGVILPGYVANKRETQSDTASPLLM